MSAATKRDAERGDDDLDKQFEPVDAVRGGGDAHRAGDRRADKCRDDADKDRHQHPDGLLTGKHQATEYADHDADEYCGDDAGDGHFSSRGG